MLLQYQKPSKNFLHNFRGSSFFESFGGARKCCMMPALRYWLSWSPMEIALIPLTIICPAYLYEPCEPSNSPDLSNYADISYAHASTYRQGSRTRQRFLVLKRIKSWILVFFPAPSIGKSIFSDNIFCSKSGLKRCKLDRFHYAPSTML